MADWNPDAPEPLNMLERFIDKSVENPALHGEMFRLVMDSELWVIVTAESVTPGSQGFTTENPPQICSFNDNTGPFTPVFSSYQAAEEKANRLPDKDAKALAGMSASIVFLMLKSGQYPVRIMTSRSQIVLPPGAIEGLLKGELTNSQPADHAPEAVTLMPIPAEDLPPALLKGIRAFCDKHPAALGVFTFRSQDQETEEFLMDEIRIVLTLRNRDNTFFNDFTLMAPKLAPDHHVLTSLIKPDDAQAIAFLAGRQPIWPVFEVE